MGNEKITIIVAEGCPHCEELKQIDNEDIKIIDINDIEAKELIGDADKFNIPLAFDADGMTCEVTIGKDNEATIINCKNTILVSENSEVTVIDLIEEDNEQDVTSEQSVNETA